MYGHHFWRAFFLINVTASIHEVFTVKLLSGACHRILLMISQHWFREWLGAVRQQAIYWTSVDPDLCGHVLLISHSELKHRSWDKMPDSLQTFSSAFSCIKLFEFGLKFHLICCWESNWQTVSIGSGNGLAPNRCQAVTWTNDDQSTDIYTHPWQGFQWYQRSLPEASFGLRVLSLPASVCVCVSVCVSITCLSAR